jgi:hypothetical protein
MMQGVFLYRFAPELWFDTPGLYPRYVLDVRGALVFADDPEFKAHLQKHNVSIPLERLPVYATYKVSKVPQSDGPIRYAATRNDDKHNASLTMNSKAGVCLNVISDVHKADALYEWKGIRLVDVVFELKPPGAIAGITGRKKGPTAIKTIGAKSSDNTPAIAAG